MITGLYFIPDTAGNSASTVLPALADRLTKTYECTPLARWTLEHRLMRSTVPTPAASTTTTTTTTTTTASSTAGSAAPSGANAPIRYMQLLTLSHLPGRSFVNITPAQPQNPSAAAAAAAAAAVEAQQKAARARTAAAASASSSSHDRRRRRRRYRPRKTGAAHTGGGSMITIAAPSGTDEFSTLLSTKMGPLWTSRQMLIVSNGLAFEVQDFRIRLGEVKQAHGAQVSRGVVVEVEWLVDRPSLSLSEADKARGSRNGAVFDGLAAGERAGGRGREPEGEEDAEDDEEDEREEEDWATGSTAIQALWNSLGLRDGKSYVLVPGLGVGSAALDLPRQYCDLLRLRA
ncbi:MAG: hypothetical protein M1838_005521 [Thelocarpon superellum]|nr:MAG: hypothetical protein M1838_005521 [Thelocarpon superellum]